MKKRMLPFAVLGMIALGAQACEVQEGDGDASPTDTLQPDAAGDTFTQDTTIPTTEYFAVFLEDRSEVRCATSNSGAHGADIDAVALWDGNDLVGYLDTTDAEHPGNCDTYGFDDTNQAEGAPSATPKLNEGFYSLSYGWLIGEFDGQAAIVPGYEMTVYEIDDDVCIAAGLNPNTNCVGSEPYSIYVATDLDCVNQGTDVDDAKSLCMVLISGTAEGTATVPLSGF